MERFNLSKQGSISAGQHVSISARRMLREGVSERTANGLRSRLGDSTFEEALARGRAIIRLPDKPPSRHAMASVWWRAVLEVSLRSE